MGCILPHRRLRTPPSSTRSRTRSLYRRLRRCNFERLRRDEIRFMRKSRTRPERGIGSCFSEKQRKRHRWLVGKGDITNAHVERIKVHVVVGGCRACLKLTR